MHAEDLGCRSGHRCKRKLTAAIQMEKWGGDQENRTLGILGCSSEADGLPCGYGVGARVMGVGNRQGIPMARGCGLPGLGGYWVILKNNKRPRGDDFSE